MSDQHVRLGRSILSAAALAVVFGGASAAIASPPDHMVPGNSTAASEKQQLHQRQQAARQPAGNGLGDAAASADPRLDASSASSAAAGERRVDADDPTGSFAAIDKATIDRLRRRSPGSDIVIPPDLSEFETKRPQEHAGDALGTTAAQHEIPIFACSADLDFDGRVDWWDLVLVLADYGRDDAAPRKQSSAANGTGHEQSQFGLRAVYANDPTGDGRMDLDDLIAVLEAWGDCG